MLLEKFGFQGFEAQFGLSSYHEILISLQLRKLLETFSLNLIKNPKVEPAAISQRDAIINCPRQYPSGSCLGVP